MKKYIALLLAFLMMLSLAACASTQTEEPEPTEPEQIVDTRLDKLAEEGWTKTTDGYAWSESSDYRTLDLAVKIEGNVLVIEIDNDYGDNNKTMEDTFKEDASIAAGMAARWFTDIERITEESFENLQYTVKIGGKAVASGGMTTAEAQNNAAEYDD